MGQEPVITTASSKEVTRYAQSAPPTETQPPIDQAELLRALTAPHMVAAECLEQSFCVKELAPHCKHAVALLSDRQKALRQLMETHNFSFDDAQEAASRLIRDRGEDLAINLEPQAGTFTYREKGQLNTIQREEPSQFDHACSSLVNQVLKNPVCSESQVTKIALQTLTDVIRHTRFQALEASPVEEKYPQMPRLVDTVIDNLETQPLPLETRKLLYELVAETKLTTKQATHLLQIQEKNSTRYGPDDNRSDLRHPSAYGFYTQLLEAQESPENNQFLAQQSQIYQELLKKINSYSPQELFDNYFDLKKSAEGLLGSQLIDPANGQVGLEIEYAPIPSLLEVQYDPIGFDRGSDGAARELRQQTNYLAFESLKWHSNLAQTCIYVNHEARPQINPEDQNSKFSIHYHVNRSTTDSTIIQRVLAPFPYCRIDRGLRDNIAFDTWEVRSLIVPTDQQWINGARVSDTAGLLLSCSKDVQAAQQHTQEALTLKPETIYSHEQLVWGHIVSQNPSPLGRLAALCALKEPQIFAIVDPAELARSYQQTSHTQRWIEASYHAQAINCKPLWDLTEQALEKVLPYSASDCQVDELGQLVVRALNCNNTSINQTALNFLSSNEEFKQQIGDQLAPALCKLLTKPSCYDKIQKSALQLCTELPQWKAQIQPLLLQALLSPESPETVARDCVEALTKSPIKLDGEQISALAQEHIATLGTSPKLSLQESSNTDSIQKIAKVLALLAESDQPEHLKAHIPALLLQHPQVFETELGATALNTLKDDQETLTQLQAALLSDNADTRRSLLNYLTYADSPAQECTQQINNLLKDEQYAINVEDALVLVASKPHLLIDHDLQSNVARHVQSDHLEHRELAIKALSQVPYFVFIGSLNQVADLLKNENNTHVRSQALLTLLKHHAYEHYRDQVVESLTDPNSDFEDEIFSSLRNSRAVTDPLVEKALGSYALKNNSPELNKLLTLDELTARRNAHIFAQQHTGTSLIELEKLTKAGKYLPVYAQQLLAKEVIETTPDTPEIQLRKLCLHRCTEFTWPAFKQVILNGSDDDKFLINCNLLDTPPQQSVVWKDMEQMVRDGTPAEREAIAYYVCRSKPFADKLLHVFEENLSSNWEEIHDLKPDTAVQLLGKLPSLNSDQFVRTCIENQILSSNYVAIQILTASSERAQANLPFLEKQLERPYNPTSTPHVEICNSLAQHPDLLSKELLDKLVPLLDRDDSLVSEAIFKALCSSTRMVNEYKEIFINELSASSIDRPYVHISSLLDHMNSAQLQSSSKEPLDGQLEDLIEKKFLSTPNYKKIRSTAAFCARPQLSSENIRQLQEALEGDSPAVQVEVLDALKQRPEHLDTALRETVLDLAVNHPNYHVKKASWELLATRTDILKENIGVVYDALANSNTSVNLASSIAEILKRNPQILTHSETLLDRLPVDNPHGYAASVIYTDVVELITSNQELFQHFGCEAVNLLGSFTGEIRSKTTESLKQIPPEWRRDSESIEAALTKQLHSYNLETQVYALEMIEQWGLTSADQVNAIFEKLTSDTPAIKNQAQTTCRNNINQLLITFESNVCTHLKEGSDQLKLTLLDLCESASEIPNSVAEATNSLASSDKNYTIRRAALNIASRRPDLLPDRLRQTLQWQILSPTTPLADKANALKNLSHNTDAVKRFQDIYRNSLDDTKLRPIALATFCQLPNLVDDQVVQKAQQLVNGTFDETKTGLQLLGASPEVFKEHSGIFLEHLTHIDKDIRQTAFEELHKNSNQLSEAQLAAFITENADSEESTNRWAALSLLSLSPALQEQEAERWHRLSYDKSFEVRMQAGNGG